LFSVPNAAYFKPRFAIWEFTVGHADRSTAFCGMKRDDRACQRLTVHGDLAGHLSHLGATSATAAHEYGEDRK